MQSQETGSFPPEEVVDFSPKPSTIQVLAFLDHHLKREFKDWKRKKDQDMSLDPSLLKEFLEPGEVIVSTGSLKAGQEFILVTSYPRLVQPDEVHVVTSFKTIREDKKKVRVLVTNKGKELKLHLYVIITSKVTTQQSQ